MKTSVTGGIQPTRAGRAWSKRLLDASFAAIAMVILGPLILVVAMLVRVRLGSPVIFSQPRPGYLERTFRLYKFRTMSDARDAEGNLLPDQDRLVPFGRFLRRTSLDELPELWNILVGDMSLVGPRPLLVRYLPHYTERERLRHSVRPGLTGLAQISGRNMARWDDRLALDVRYVETWSLGLDLRILWETFRQVIRGQDVEVAPSTRMEDLDRERASTRDASPKTT